MISCFSQNSELCFLCCSLAIVDPPESGLGEGRLGKKQSQFKGADTSLLFQCQKLPDLADILSCYIFFLKSISRVSRSFLPGNSQSRFLCYIVFIQIFITLSVSMFSEIPLPASSSLQEVLFWIKFHAGCISENKTTTTTTWQWKFHPPPIQPNLFSAVSGPQLQPHILLFFRGV